MNVSPQMITIVVLTLVCTVLVLVTRSQHLEIRSQKSELENAQIQADEQRSQIQMLTEQRDAERRRIAETIQRLDEALTEFVNNTEDIHAEHEERMSELQHIETPETQDWLCDPVPDDIRRLFGCDSGTDNNRRNEIRPANSIDAALH